MSIDSSDPQLEFKYYFVFVLILLSIYCIEFVLFSEFFFEMLLFFVSPTISVYSTFPIVLLSFSYNFVEKQWFSGRHSIVINYYLCGTQHFLQAKSTSVAWNPLPVIFVKNKNINDGFLTIYWTFLKFICLEEFNGFVFLALQLIKWVFPKVSLYIFLSSFLLHFFGWSHTTPASWFTCQWCLSWWF